VGPQGWGDEQAPTAGVRLLDYAAPKALRSIVAGARALVMPSRDEGFGLPVLEGLAVGTAVIVSTVPALLEVAGGHAAVFEIGDVDGLAAALHGAALPVDDVVEQQVRKQRREYAAGWTWQRCAEATMGAYRIAAP
jgi:glycosyltransferase involved in cell wall biosynthesis